MLESLLNNDPIISMLFNTIIKKNGMEKRPSAKTVFSKEYVIKFLENLGTSENHIKKIVNELLKDILFMEALQKKIDTVRYDHKAKDKALYYFEKLQKQTAEAIARKIIIDDANIQNSRLLYAKLQVLRKYQELCSQREIFYLISGALKGAYESHGKAFGLNENSKINTEGYGKVINLSDYRKRVSIN